MKIYKKLGIVIGLSPLIFIFMALALPKLATRTAAAAGPYSAAQINSATFDFQDRATIIGHFGADTVLFTDKNPTDTNGVAHFEPPGGIFCTNDHDLGLLVQRSNFDISKSGSPPGAINATIHLNSGSSANACTQVAPIRTVGVQKAANAFAYVTWDDSDLLTVNGKTLHAVCTTTPGCTTTDEFLENPDKKCNGLIAITDGAGHATIYELQPNKYDFSGNDLIWPPTADVSAKLHTYAPDCFVSSINFKSVHDKDNVKALAAQQVDIAGAKGTTAPGAPGAAGSATTSACETGAEGFSLTWLACPVLDAASALSDKLIGLFEGQLSFSVSQLGTGQDQVHKSWALMRDISTALIVIVALVMILSQAASFGPFDAYTVRKMLPKIVAAVILIQISWVGVSWVIDLVNAMASGIADILYFPFGGSDNMNLFALLGHANIGSGTAVALDWAAIGIGLALGIAFAFTMLGVAFVAVIALFTAILTLIFRKVLIIILLIFAPLALLAWILPGTERYWKMWRENLIKVLMMFPIAVAIISAGRVFAYVVGTQPGNGGEFVALLLVLVGFFGPLFVLPKTFKWGGQAMSLAGKAISDAGTKAGAPGKKFFGTRQEEWSALRRSRSQERVAAGAGFNPRRPWHFPLDKFRSGDWDPTRGVVPKGFLGRFNMDGSKRRQAAHDRYVEAGEKSEQEDVNAAEARLVRERQAHRARGGDHDLMLQAIADGLESYEDPNLGHVELGRRNSIERTAARKQLAKLGAGMNWRYLENYYQSAMDDTSAGSDERRAEMRKFFDDNVDTIIPKLPHIYKSIGQAADADPSGIAQMHGVETEAILSHLGRTIQDPTLGGTRTVRDAATGAMRPMNAGEIDRARAGAQGSLATYLQNFQRAVEGSQRGGPQLENGSLRAMKAFLDRDTSPGGVADTLLHDINEGTGTGGRAHSRTAPGRSAVIPGAAPRVLTELHNANDIVGSLNPDDQRALEAMRTSLGGQINEGGYVTASAPATPTTATRGTPTQTPGELRVSHQETVTVNLPTGAELANPTQYQTYKARLQTDASAVQSLAHGLAYGVVDGRAAHLGVLDDLKAEVEALPANDSAQEAAKAARVKEYNGMLDQIRQAYTQRISQTAQAAADRGHDRAAALTAAQNRLAPEITADVESRRIV